jgi:hypothetical protein
MSRYTFLRVLFVAFVAALAIVPGTALAAKPIEQFHGNFTDSFSDELCEIPVDFVVVGTENVFLYDDESFRGTLSVRQTVTNPANGNSVIISSARQIRGSAPVVDEEAGTITFLVSFKGLPEKIQTANGPVLLRDAGIATFANTFDLATGDFISTEIVFLKGPHPDLDSDGALFCEVITGALE